MLSVDQIKELLIENPASILQMEYEALLKDFGPEIANMKGCAQNNPHHSYDVLEHCVRTVMECEADGEMRLAALYHDCGKPECKSVNSRTGFDTFYGHEALSAQIFRNRFFHELSRSELEDLTFIIKHHDIGMHMVLNQKYENEWNLMVNAVTVHRRHDEFGASDTLHGWDLMGRTVELARADTLAQSNLHRETKLQILDVIEGYCNAEYDHLVDLGARW